MRVREVAMIEAMRDEARRLFAGAVAAADPGRAVTRALEAAPVAGTRVWAVAVGKAARAMAEAAITHLDPLNSETGSMGAGRATASGAHRGMGARPTIEARKLAISGRKSGAIAKLALSAEESGLMASGGRVAGMIVVTNAENAAPLNGAEVHVAGHPVPDAGGLKAAEAVEAMLARTSPGDVVLALISGGGSALLPAPVAGVSLAEKAEASRLMLGAGLDITEMNSVRQHLSRLKGGGLARAAAPARVVALILSDVIGDDLRVVASGPTVAPICARAKARKLLQARGLWERMPGAVRAALEREEAEAPVPAAENRLIGSNRMSLDAVVAASGAELWSDRLTGDVGAAADWLVARMRAAPAGRVLAVCGGETTVTLRGQGRGGRNQELALRVAVGLEGPARPWVFLSGGTDGRDGPTEAAGGLVDGGTLGRIAAAGGDWRALLAENDSNRALTLAGDLLVTGGTGTNVADVQIVILG
jgi:glycerate 2-kinase